MSATLRVNLLTCDERRATLTIEVLGLTLVAAASNEHTNTKHGPRYMSSRVESRYSSAQKAALGFSFCSPESSIIHYPERGELTYLVVPSIVLGTRHHESTVKRNGEGATERQRRLS